jgi:YaiO family outer membrane protein
LTRSVWGRIQCLVWLCLWSASGFTAEPTRETGASPLTRVREAFQRRDLAAASREIDQQLDQKPDDIEWLLLRADLVGARGRAAEALAQTRAIRERYPESRLARMKEAQLLARMGRLNSAQAIYEELLEVSASGEIRTLLAMTHQWQGDWARAEVLLAVALRESREDSLPSLAQLRGLVSMGQVSRAWTMAIQQDLATGQADAEIGMVLAGIAGGIDAFEHLDAFASRPTPDVGIAQGQTALRARHWARLGRTDRALEFLQSIAESQPPHYDAFIEAANGYTAVGEQALARRYYLRALELTPERVDAWLGLARLASREGRLNGSLAIYQKLTTDNPEAFEGWLGQIHMAQLLDDLELAETALREAWRLAPRSALLHREHLRLALLRGDLEGFRDGVRDYLRDQPSDRVAHLMNARLRWAESEAVALDEVRALFDPLAPELGSQVMQLALRISGDLTSTLEHLPKSPAPELIEASSGKLAEWMAVLGERNAARELANRGHPSSIRWVNQLASGWWAYMSGPMAVYDLLARDLDPQARAIWLASLTQNRLRTLAIETESALEDEWLLHRALWFHRWQGRRNSVEAALDLVQTIRGMVSGWETGVTSLEIQEAWRESEQPLEDETLSRRMVQARWKQYRFDYAGALQNYQQIERAHPESTNPVQAQAQVLRASGRWSEAVILLRRLAAVEDPPPLIRLDYAELLRRLGRFDEARQQLETLAATGFDEPELYLHRIGIARSEGSDAAEQHWLRTGLERFPNATGLVRYQAELWLEQQRTKELAQLLVGRPAAAWCNPDHLSVAWMSMDSVQRQKILESAAWWFNWQWLPWERIEARSVAELERRSEVAAAAGQPALALRYLTSALDAQIPDSELWLKAARLYDFNGQREESALAYELAEQLGLGRPDAIVSRLTQDSRRRPIEIAREFARRLEDQPDDPALQKGLVTALLRSGEVHGAALALAPLLTGAPEDIEVRMLAAEVKSAQGRIRQARSLYNSILRNDPLAADAHAGLIALGDVSEWGISAGYEYDALQDTSGAGAEFEDWQEAFVSTYWRRPFRQTLALEYRWFDRHDARAQQIGLDWARALDRDWVARLSAAGAQDADIIAKWRAGGGISHRLTETLWAGLDARFLDYTDVNVWQVIPSATWRWHPRSTMEGRLFLSDNQFKGGGAETSLTWLFQASWEFSRQSVLTLFYAQGDENSLDPIPGLIANDQYLSVGANFRFWLNRHWSIQPSYRFESHDQFDLHGLGLNVTRRF